MKFEIHTKTIAALGLPPSPQCAHLKLYEIEQTRNLLQVGHGKHFASFYDLLRL